MSQELLEAAQAAAEDGMKTLALGLERGGEEAARCVAFGLAVLGLWRDLVAAGASWPEAVAAARPTDWSGPFVIGWAPSARLAGRAGELLDDVAGDPRRWSERLSRAWAALRLIGGLDDDDRRWIALGCWVAVSGAWADVAAADPDAGVSLIQAVEIDTNEDGLPAGMRALPERIEPLPDGRAGFAVRVDGGA